MFRKCCKILILNEIGNFNPKVGVFGETVNGVETTLSGVFGPKPNDACELNACGDVKAANTTTTEALPILDVGSTDALREAALAAAAAHSDKAMKIAIDELITWQKGFTSEKIEIRKGKFGWGTFAREDLDEGFEIVNIAREDEITVERAVEFIGTFRLFVRYGKWYERKVKIGF